MVASKSPDPYSAKHPFPNFFSFWRKAEKPNEDSPPWTRLYRRFTLKELRLATDNFGLKIGQDGHYSVYKGFINGGFNETVTIKMYDNNSLISQRYFLSEMELPWKRDHPNVLSLIDCHVSIIICGTLGYTDPEYIVSGLLTLKSDVYSFGVVLFAVLSARKPMERSILEEQGISVMQWWRQCVEDDKVGEIMDPRMKVEVAPDCLKAYADIAYKCSNERGSERPSMADVVKRLELILLFQECFEADLPFSPSWLASIAPSPKKNEPLSGVDFQDSNIFVSDYDSEELLRD
ncbi:hypothetical protein E1A91_D02G130800v1 [Gossypium mustelinum]|uniref:Protein kinase domain-containing protein n=1 Tax=Gossypium mustelinum TaxID=34275 RepID=A0A5D2VW64_GOSMU|nr:hypothetical protein E1A91_D02G130800v1 [Gossypium mustelinum]